LSRGNEKLLERWLREGMEAGRIDLAREVFAEDFVGHDEMAPVRGRDQLMAQASGFRGAFDDVVVDLGSIESEEDRVSCTFEFRGRQTRPFGPLPASGGTIRLPGTIIVRAQDGKFVEGWQVVDYTELMPPGAPAPAPPGTSSQPEAWAARWDLSPRIAKVARLAMQGLSDREIGLHLGLSIETVRTYLRDVFRAARVSNRTELLAAARTPVG